MKVIVGTVLFAILFFINPAQALSESNFLTDYNVIYTINEGGITNVNFEISLTNKTSQYYAGSYSIEVGYNDLTNVKASDQSGSIKPFINKVLGWDTEDFSEFKVEYPERGKRIDMLICLDGISQFVIEAKALTKELVDNREFYSQAINYAHSKEKSFAILTNFRHWIVLRCDINVDFPERACIGIIDLICES